MAKKIKFIVGLCVVAFFGFTLFLKYNRYNISLLSPFATSTPIIITKNPETDKSNDAIKTYQLSNFSFEHSQYDEIADSVAWEGLPCPGEIMVRVPYIAYEETSVYISTSPTTSCTDFNGNAKTLNDYTHDYKGAFFTTVVHSSEKVSVNGIPMLKQIYSVGYTRKDNNGKEIFDTSDRGWDHQLRYVFFDGKKFVIIEGWQAPEYVEKIVKTIKLVK